MIRRLRDGQGKEYVTMDPEEWSKFKTKYRKYKAGYKKIKTNKRDRGDMSSSDSYYRQKANEMKNSHIAMAIFKERLARAAFVVIVLFILFIIGACSGC